MRWVCGLAAIAWIGVVAHADPIVECTSDDCAQLPSDVAAALATTVAFDPGRAQLSAAAKAALDPVVTVLIAHASVRIVIVGHSAADTATQLEVARRRADVVKWYLIDGGIVTDRIETTVSGAAAQAIELQLAIPAPAVPTSASLELDRDASEMASILTHDPITHRSPGQAGANLDRQLADVRNRRITIGDDSIGFRDDHSDIDTGHAPGGLEIRRPRLPIAAPKHGEDDLRRTTLATRAIEMPPPPPEVARRLTASYLPGLVRCYHKSLASDATLAGRVGLSFGLDADGRPVDPAADGVDPDLDSCIRTQMIGWRFSLAHDPRRPPPADARFAVSLALQPD